MKTKNKFILTGLASILVASVGNVVSAESYTVQAGDTLTKIAANHQTTVDKIVKNNKLSNPNVILIGQVLELSETTQDAVTSVNEVAPFVNAQGKKETVEVASTAKNEVVEPINPVVNGETNTSASDAATPTSTLSSDEQAAKEWIAQKESSGSYTAQNGIYYGRYQLTLSYLNGDLSPENQERVADEYVKNRYGSWVQAYQFWLANGWY